MFLRPPCRDEEVIMSAEHGRVIPFPDRQLHVAPRGAFPVDGTAALQPDPVISERPALVSLPSPIDGGAQESLSTKLARARDVFVAQEKGKKKAMDAYEIQQDAVVYRVLAEEKGKLGYEEAKHDLDSYIKMQLETHLGERLHVGISRFTHTIIDGELRVAETNESLYEMIKRGRDYRRENGKPVDWDREDAEVVGFGRIQNMLTDKHTPVGTMMFFVSPPGEVDKGSIYKQNFYDVHHKVSDNRVESYRYTSGLTPEQSQSRLQTLDKRYTRTSVPLDSEFIANPVVIKPGTAGLETPDAIHTYMHVDHAHMSREKFAVVMAACQPLIQEYCRSLADNPDNLAAHQRNLNILMNYADQVAAELETVPAEKVVAFSGTQRDARPWIPPAIDEAALANKKVRVTDTGCGSSGGGESSSSVFSVAEFGKDADGKCKTCGKNSKDNHYHCPGCTKRYSDETTKDATDRTKQCGCGFNFGC